jgi:NADP-dependent 3-hydroxy acid dehydrogenase YdfG
VRDYNQVKSLFASLDAVDILINNAGCRHLRVSRVDEC